MTGPALARALGFVVALIAIHLLLPSAVRAAGPADPIVIGQTFILHSDVLDEDRRINVYRPSAWDLDPKAPLPVMYMPDGGMAEDFLHIAGLLQVSVGNGTMRPFLLVGIENTERRRDLTPPTSSEQDRKIAPRAGGSAVFRDFIRDELIPEITNRYPVTQERAIVGESLAGLFIVETWLLEPGLFQHYFAFDPSLWWDDGRLPREAAEKRAWQAQAERALHIANSSEPTIDPPVRQFVAAVRASGIDGLQLNYKPMPAETHMSIYHPAALQAFRAALAPTPASP